MKIPLLLLQILTILMALVLLACGSDSGSHADGDIDAGPSDATGPADTSGPTDVTGPAVTVQDITNAILTGLSGDCADYAAVYESMVRDVNRSMNFRGELSSSLPRVGTDRGSWVVDNDRPDPSQARMVARQICQRRLSRSGSNRASLPGLKGARST